MIKKIGFISLLALLFTNCTFQKRTHQKGYFVQWNHKNKMTSRLVEKEILTEVSISSFETNYNDSMYISKSDFENEISRKTEDEVIKQENVISNEKQSEVRLTKDDEKINKVKQNDFFLKNKKDELEKEKKEFPLIFVIGFLSLMLGLILFVRAFSTKYINNAFFPAIGLTAFGLFLLLVSIVKSITKSYRLKHPKPEKPINEKLSKVKSKRMKVFFVLLTMSMLSIGFLFYKS